MNRVIVLLLIALGSAIAIGSDFDSYAKEKRDENTFWDHTLEASCSIPPQSPSPGALYHFYSL